MAQTPSRLRRGSGILIMIVLALMVILTAWAFSMTFYSKGAAKQSARAQFRERIAIHTHMALTEAAHWIRTHANDDGTPSIFNLVRDYDGGSIELAAKDLAATSAEVARYPGYSIGDVRVDVLQRAATGRNKEELVAYEGVGVLRLTVEGFGPNSTRSTRIEDYGFRAVLTAPPRPFDMLTVYVQDPWTLLSKGAYNNDPNATLDWIVQKNVQFQATLQKYEQWTRRLGELSNLSSKLGRTDHSPALNQLADLVGLARQWKDLAPGTWPFPPWTVVHPSAGGGGQYSLHYFSRPLLVFSAEDEFDLTQLDLPSEVGDRVESILGRNKESRKLDEGLQAILQSYEQYLQQQSAPDDATIARDVQEWERQLREIVILIHSTAKEWAEMMEAYKKFQDALVEVSDPAEHTRLTNRARRLEMIEQDVRSHYRFLGAGAAAEAAKFLSPDRGPPPSGTVYVSDPKETLHIRIEGLTGRLQVISTGPMQVDRATVDNLNRDVLMLIGYKEVNVAGQCEAAVISWGSRYYSNGQDIRGALILDQVDPGASFEDIKLMFSGTVYRQKAILSGKTSGKFRGKPFDHVIHVALDPAPPFRIPDAG